MTPRELLTPEERARIYEIQDRLIDRFLGRHEALATGDARRARELSAEIDDLMDEREMIERLAGADAG